MMFTVYVDADACPVIRTIETVAKHMNVPVELISDTNHVLSSDYSRVRIIGAGADAVDLALINLLKAGDVVVTQDYGVAALALGKKAYAIHQSGKVFTDDNIGGLLMDRHIARKARMAKGKNHLKGPKKRTVEDDMRFEVAFRKLLEDILERNGLTRIS